MQFLVMSSFDASAMVVAARSVILEVTLREPTGGRLASGYADLLEPTIDEALDFLHH